MAGGLTVRVCPEHEGHQYLGATCPLCDRGAWPTRDERAADDFRGLGLVDVRLVTPGGLVRSLAAGLIEAEAEVARAMRAAVGPRNRMRRDCRAVGVPHLPMTRAVRVFVGLPGAETLAEDPEVATLLACLRGEIE